MQLFITDFLVKDKKIVVENSDILNQIRKVLRLQIGDIVDVQNDKIRYEIEITARDDKSFTGTILKEIPKTEKSEHKGMFVAMPNKWDKIELITQKLTEIWIDEIIFFPSERSIIKQWNEKKEQRLMKIVREAVEQSWGWGLPTVKFVPNIQKELEGKNIVVFDKTDREIWKIDTKNLFWLVGPEGWLTERDYEKLWENYSIHTLGETILRTETAAIVGGWIIKNET